MAVEDIGARRLAGLIPRPLSRPARAGKFDQPMRPRPAAHSHEATRISLQVELSNLFTTRILP